MAFGLKSMLFGGPARQPETLSPSVSEALASWRASPSPDLDESHFQTRYVIVDIATSGPSADKDALLGISAVGLRGLLVSASDSFALDFASEEARSAAVDSQLAAFLTYAAKAPLVTFHVPLVRRFLERAYRERLAVDFQPQWIDLAWLLPSFFRDRHAKLQSLDKWLEIFAIGGDQRRNMMENTLVLARLLQMVLARAHERNILTAERLIEESESASELRGKR